MPIKLATPAPLTFELRRGLETEPCFHAVERPELTIRQNRYARYYVDLGDVQVSADFESIEQAEKTANAIHARLCTFEQPQPEDATAKPLPVRDERQHASDCATNNAPALPPGPCDCAYSARGE